MSFLVIFSSIVQTCAHAESILFLDDELMSDSFPITEEDDVVLKVKCSVNINASLGHATSCSLTTLSLDACLDGEQGRRQV